MSTATADLVRWTFARLVNRTDCYGGYRPPEEWGREYRRKDGTTGQLGQQTTHKRPLTAGRLARHFRARGRTDVIGVHSTSIENTSLWGATDIDAHDGGRADPEANLRAALAWYARLVQLGFRPLLVDSNGKGGYHLWTLFATPIPTALAYAFARWLVADHREHDLAVAPETFPKQPRVDPGRFGNWLRIPGKHHSRPHWSKVWNGSAWLEGRAAADGILVLAGDAPSLIPTEVQSAPPRPTPTTSSPWKLHATSSDHLARRIRGRMARLPRRSVGEGRRQVGFGFAAWLTHDLALSDTVALPWLVEWNAGNVPPLSEAQLLDVLRCGREYGRNPVGCGLEDPTRTVQWQGGHRCVTLHSTFSLEVEA